MDGLGHSHLLRCLIRPERQSSTSTVHNCSWVEATENAGLVVFAWRELRANSIISMRQRRTADWTGTFMERRGSEVSLSSTVETEYVSAKIKEVRGGWKWFLRASRHHSFVGQRSPAVAIELIVASECLIHDD
jgi:hypothetical protein